MDQPMQNSIKSAVWINPFYLTALILDIRTTRNTKLKFSI